MLKSLGHKYVDLNSSFFLSLQNNTKELWSLLNFIEPSKFPSLDNFQETYGTMDSEYQASDVDASGGETY